MGPQGKVPLKTGEELFESWLNVRSNASRDALSVEAAAPYRYIWLSWCRWLDENASGETNLGVGKRYLEARPEDVQQFLDHGPSPSSKRVSRTTPISEVTRRRYWRILDAVYDHAKDLEFIKKNPADVGDNDRPPPEKSEGLVLTRLHFEAVYKVLPSGPSPWDLRDRAVLLLLLEAALTPGEITGLKLANVTESIEHPGQLVLNIFGTRKAQNRDFTLNKLASTSLTQWLDARQNMACPLDEVFITQRQEPMAGRVLFHLVSKAISASAKLSGMPVPGHVGAQVLRNTCIVQWLNSGMEEGLVVKLAGFKDSKSFRGLREHIRVRVSVPEMKLQPGT